MFWVFGIGRVLACWFLPNGCFDRKGHTLRCYLRVYCFGVSGLIASSHAGFALTSFSNSAPALLTLHLPFPELVLYVRAMPLLLVGTSLTFCYSLPYSCPSVSMRATTVLSSGCKCRYIHNATSGVGRGRKGASMRVQVRGFKIAGSRTRSALKTIR